MKYPKILIIGQYFNTRSGGGITMTNLFSGWEKEKIAVVSEYIENPNFAVCDKYYQLGGAEIRKKFPFNLNFWKKKGVSGILDETEGSKILPVSNKIKPGWMKKIYPRFLDFSGLSHYKNRYFISSRLLTWIKAYAPDIIYTQLSTIELILLVSELRESLNIPVCIHIMDDWPKTIVKNGPFQSYWKKYIDRSFRNLLAVSKVRLSISESMSLEYESRYQLSFIPFHNPIDLRFWGRYSKRSYGYNGNFKILYAGRIGPGIRQCFLDIALAIKSLINKGLNIELHIQATNSDQVLDDLTKFDFVKLNSSVPYEEIPSIFSAADMLLLPNDFDQKSISFLKFSMPTKASEYMISGTPILLYSSAETAVTHHALKYRWAYVVSENIKEKLETAIFELYSKEELRINLGAIAREYAIDHFDSVRVREEFRNSLAINSK